MNTINVFGKKINQVQRKIEPSRQVFHKTHYWENDDSEMLKWDQTTETSIIVDHSDHGEDGIIQVEPHIPSDMVVEDTACLECIDEVPVLTSAKSHGSDNFGTAHLAFPPKTKIVIEQGMTCVFPLETKAWGDIRDYVFVYEFGGDVRTIGWPEHSRWKCCTHVYFVWQGTNQLGAARTLYIPHLQISTSDAIKELKKIKFPCSTKFILVGPEGDIDDFNMYITHSPSPKEIEEIFFPEYIELTIEKFQLTNKPKEKNNEKEREARQRDYVDLGYCSHVNMSHNEGCNLGLTRPRTFKETLKAENREIMGTTKPLLHALFVAKVMKGYILDTERQAAYAKRIHGDNVVEAVRIHETWADESGKHLCIKHVDRQNSKIFARVIWWSCLSWLPTRCVKRIGLVGYWRASVDYCDFNYKRKKNFLEVCEKSLQSIGKARQTFCGLNFELCGIPWKAYDFLPLRIGPCNLRPESYLQPFVYHLQGMLREIRKPTFHKEAYLLAVIGSHMYSAVYTALALRIYRRYNSFRELGVIYRQVCDLLHKKTIGKDAIAIPFSFFAYCDTPLYQESYKKDLDKSIGILAMEIEKSWRCNRLAISQNEYNRLHTAVLEIPGISEWQSDHIIGLAAIVGIIPLEMFKFVINGAQDAKSMLEKRCKENLPSTWIDDIKHLALQTLKRPVKYQRIAENIACKIGQQLMETQQTSPRGRETFKDVWEIEFPSFEVVANQNHCKIILGNGLQVFGPLLHKAKGRWIPTTKRAADLPMYNLMPRDVEWIDQLNFHSSTGGLLTKHVKSMTSGDCINGNEDINNDGHHENAAGYDVEDYMIVDSGDLNSLADDKFEYANDDDDTVTECSE